MSTLHHSLLVTLLVLTGCGAATTRPLQPVDRVDLPRFMGDWYVIAHIPFFTEKNAFNAVESYRLDERGRVRTTFTFNEGALDGNPRRMEPVGFPVSASNNAIWGMQFIWPIRADYRIIHLDPDYTRTVIGREKRDYAWIMARTPELPEAEYKDLVRILVEAGYDITHLRRVPHGSPPRG